MENEWQSVTEMERFRAYCPEPHTQPFLWASLCSPLGCFCVFGCLIVLCQCECVTVQLKEPLWFPTHRPLQLHTDISLLQQQQNLEQMHLLQNAATCPERGGGKLLI